MGNGIFQPMFDPAVEKYADDIIEARHKTGRKKELAHAAAERQLWANGTEEELLVDRFVRELPEVKLRLLRRFSADVTGPIKNHVRYAFDKAEDRAVGFVAMVVRQIYHDDLKKRETLSRLGREETLGPVPDDNARARALNGLYFKYAHRVCDAFSKVRSQLGITGRQEEAS